MKRNEKKSKRKQEKERSKRKKREKEKRKDKERTLKDKVWPMQDPFIRPVHTHTHTWTALMARFS